MTPELPAPAAVRLPALQVVAVAASAGMAGGFAEAATVLVRRGLEGRMLLFGPDLLWMTPLAEAVVFGVVGTVYAALGRLIPALRRPGLTVGLFVSLGALAALLQVDALHLAASAVLAAGIGSVAGRRAAAGGVGRPAAAGFAVGMTLIGLVAGARALKAATRPDGPGASSAAASARRPNVLLLVLDTVRAWNLGFHGYQRATTPRLDQRLSGGVVFERAVAPAPWTLPSHAALFTGRPAFDLSAGWDRPLDGRYATLAEVLRDAGYATGGFVGNYRYAGGATGLGRGFERYDDYPVDAAEALRMTGLGRRVFRIPAVQTWLGRNRILEARTAEDVNRSFLRWVDRRGEAPFFAFLNYVDAHSPYLPPTPFDTLWVNGDDGRISSRYAAGVARVFGGRPIPPGLVVEYLDGYDGALSYLDRQIDSLLGELDRRGLLENTLVVLTADHGEHFGEHNLIQHGNSLYLPLLHVPLALWGPRFVPAGVRVSRPASLTGVAATIAELTGIPTGRLGGQSLVPLWGPVGDSAPVDAPVAAVDWHRSVSRFPPSPLLEGSLRGIVLDTLHYIRRSDGTEELYDLRRDFLEARNLAGRPDARAALAAARAALDSVTGGRAGPGPTG